MEEFFSGTGLWIGYILIVLGVIVALAFVGKSVMSDFSGAKIPVIGTAVILVIFLICYSISGSETTYDPKFEITESSSKMISALIHTGVTLFVLGGLAGLVGSVYTMIKK